MSIRRTTEGGGAAGLADRLERLAVEAPRLVREEVRAEIEEVVREEFQTSTAPSGDRWAPRKRGGGHVLVRTGQMGASTQVTETDRGVVVTMDEPANFHQKGTVRMPARPLFPGGKRSRWNERIQAAMARVARRLLESV